MALGSPWGSDPVWGASTPWGGALVPFGGLTVPANAVVPVPSTGSPLGTDIVCLYDLDPYFSLTSTGIDCLAQDLYHSITTQNGSLFYAPAYGIDIRQSLNGAVTEQILGNLSSTINFQIQNDERVQTSTCSLNWNSDTETLLGNIGVIPATSQPFTFVIAATGLTVSLLSVNPSSV